MKRTLAIMIVVIMALSVVACGAGSKENKVVGTWVLDSGVGEDAELAVSMMKAFGMEMSIEFKADGTGKVNTSYGDEVESEDFNYEMNGDQIVIKDTDMEAGSIKLDGNKLIMESEGMQLVFKKK